MANEPVNLILVHLREMRTTLAEHTARFDRIDERFAQIDERFAQIDERFAQIDERFAQNDGRFAQMQKHFDQRFDQMEKRFADLHAIASHTFGLSAAYSLKSQEFERRHEFAEGEQRRIGERVDELERRIAKVEEEERDG